ncbi:MAG: TlpA disulfide reductase family protein [Pseudomonadota bacterium]
MRLKKLLAATIALTLGFVLPLGASSGLDGAKAPDFSLTTFTGNTMSLAEQKGDVVMINFWATWCGPCRQEMPILDELFTRYERAGFQLLGVNIDDEPARAKAMIAELGVSFPVLFDSDKKVSELYDVQAMPVSVMVDREGVVRYVHYGYKPGYEDKYLDQIRELIRE